MADQLVVRGAREHNLRNVSLDLPRDQLIVFTGLSGSGKSSLAFDTIYAEGQRRYVESLSAYARQFLGQMDKPDVDFIEGLSPAISIDQKSALAQPALDGRHHHRDLRLPAPAVRPRRRAALPEVTARVVAAPDAAADRRPDPRAARRAPASRCWRRWCGAARASTQSLLEDLAGARASPRARIDGEVHELDRRAQAGPLREAHHRGRGRPPGASGTGIERALTDSLETALRARPTGVGRGPAGAPTRPARHADETLDLQPAPGLPRRAAPSFDELAPRNFSFNSPYGACPAATGWAPVRGRPRAGGARPRPVASTTAPSPRGRGERTASTSAGCSRRVAEAYGFSTSTPWRKLHEGASRRWSCTASGDKQVPRRSTATATGRRTSLPRPLRGRGALTCSGATPRPSRIACASTIEGYMREVPCPACGGARLKPEGAGGAPWAAATSSSCATCRSASRAAGVRGPASCPSGDHLIADRVLKEIRARLAFLRRRRPRLPDASTASAGDPRRRRGAAHPPGHPDRLAASSACSTSSTSRRSACTSATTTGCIDTLMRLRDLGNTVIVVEHDEDTIRAADHVVDIGPGAGEHGGDVVVVRDPVEVLLRTTTSLTGQYLSGKRRIPVPAMRRQPAAARRWRSRAPASTTCKASTSRSRSAACVASPACRARASPRWSTTSCCRALMQRDLPGQGRRPARHTRASRASSARQGDRHRPVARSAARRARTRPPTPGSFDHDPRAVRAARPRPRCAATSRAASRFNVQGRPLRGLRGRRHRSRSRCTSCPTSTCPARCARARATTATRSRSRSRARTSPTCST